ncbi:3-hydroxyisobutyrate dehydrogenase-like beta-hydroxyacid dehydrogenase [Kitasatospora sp. MAA4]|uniref:NAD(P)-dependent oxidoreductase n=1 Tax=Kitasatospora sp. MAA4 TaxID=3035093 RepID=UPI002473537A|nr:NAD(P)-dependent oxidoreductase [Kitasatospora sp. MAA4]MDH6136779.1 3-hydroxyisobutyrate dehydrogenase-like beta-hydroxyacid dehydrogenase [Kitasatospora sp. MAA4]
MNVGFVGLGAMGREMAGQLLAAGHRVQVWNRSPEPVRELVERGALAAGSLAEALGNEVVVSMLADDAAVESLLLDEALLATAGAAVHVNMATVSPALARRAAELHARHGLGYVAAPVLGRTDVAAAGNLTILAAGESSMIDRVAPLFDAMGRATRRLGDQPQLANIAKISANFMLVSAIEAFAEASALAEAGGLASEELLAILTNTILPGPVYAGYGAMIAERRYEPAGFRLALGLKDVGLALDAGAEAGVPLPFADVLRTALTESVAHGDGGLDLAALGERARRRAGLST